MTSRAMHDRCLAACHALRQAHPDHFNAFDAERRIVDHEVDRDYIALNEVATAWLCADRPPAAALRRAKAVLARLGE